MEDEPEVIVSLLLSDRKKKSEGYDSNRMKRHIVPGHTHVPSDRPSCSTPLIINILCSNVVFFLFHHVIPGHRLTPTDNVLIAFDATKLTK